MKRPKYERILMGDFETTSYEGQTKTEVWASALVELNTEDVKIFHSIDDTFFYLIQQKGNSKVFYHNLKFDGAFWLDFLMKKIHLKPAIEQGEAEYDIKMKQDLDEGEYRYVISDFGQWYCLEFKYNGKLITIQDSLKLLPFSVREIGRSFGTKHKKLDMEYKGFRYAGCKITDEEKEYIANDVLVVKEALEILFAQGHNKMTIGSCCLAEFYKTFSSYFERLNTLPELDKLELDVTKFGSSNVDEYIRKSYRGGWCYCVRGKENQMKFNGTTADVNSLYPSMMSSESGNYFPFGKPTFWKGNYIPRLSKDKFYFVRIRTRFYIKKGYLPFIQLKGNPLFVGHECLESSDVFDKATKEYYSHYKKDGKVVPARVEMTLTQTDLKLIQEHYNLVDFEILDGCWFYAQKGLFDKYINKYKKIKMESKGAIRQLAKLFLNNLYGKLSASSISDFKYAITKEDGSIGFVTIRANDKKAGYIAIGSAITSYARNFTIRAAQQNYYGKNERGFCYADTDSIHCDLLPEEIKGIKVDANAFCCWKLESCWDKALFVRQKTYAEHITHQDLEEIEKPFWELKCAGMPQKCKDLFLASVNKEIPDGFSEDEKEWIKEHDFTIEDFKVGLKVQGKLMPKRIDGGIILVDTEYTMR